MKYTIEDVAKEAGVSITTVSRVMNGNYPVKAETKKRVEKAIEKFNYKPNPLASGLIKNRTYCIGVVIPGITNMFFTEVMYGIEKYAKSLGYHVFLSNSEGEPQVERDNIYKLNERLVDGIISIDPQTENILSGFYEEMSEKKPLICINGYHKNTKINYVISDEEMGTRNAFEYLLSLGHKNIAFIRGGKSYSYDLKENIYREYMRSLNIKEIIIDSKDGNSTAVVENVTNRIIEIHNDEYKLGEDITAFFACNDLMATGALNGCRACKLDVPDDISLIGFDNIILSQMTRPKITTVDQNMRLLGETAANKLIELIESKENYCDTKLVATTLIKRDSCRKL